MQNTLPEEQPKLGISGCLLGWEVRFNGNHCRNRYAVDVLGHFFEWQPFCPEVAMGMTVPREPVFLRGDPEKPRMIGKSTGADYTAQMESFLAGIEPVLKKSDLDGFLVKKRSPTCGLERIAVQSKDGRFLGFRDGLFTELLKKMFPMMPIEDEGRLHDADLRESFINRVYAWKRWKQMSAHARPGDLVAFHTDYKLLLMARDPNAARHLGRMVARAGREPLPGIMDAYLQLFMETMKKNATVKRQTNVLYRLMGVLGDRISSPDRLEMERYIKAYSATRVPLSAPLILMSHHFRRHPQKWQAVGKYLEPYPWGFETGFVLPTSQQSQTLEV